MNKFIELLHEIAEQLTEQTGMSWYRVPLDDESYDVTYGHLETVEAAANVGVDQRPWPYKLSLRDERGRLHITGSMPRPSDRIYLRYEPPTITCAISRGAKAIARDIERRMLPMYDDMLQDMAKQILSHEEWTRDRDAVAFALVAADPTAQRRSDDRVESRFREYGWWSARVSQDHISELTIFSLPVDKAIEIVKLLLELQ